MGGPIWGIWFNGRMALTSFLTRAIRVSNALELSIIPLMMDASFVDASFLTRTTC